MLYLPAHAPFDLFDREHRRGIKLYVRRVFIMDDAEQLMPNYLRFVRGIVDAIRPFASVAPVAGCAALVLGACGGGGGSPPPTARLTSGLRPF